MKIVSWNVNGIRAVEKKDFVPWLLSCGADVVCLQETKARPEQLSEELRFPRSAEQYEDEPLFSAALSKTEEAEPQQWYSYFYSAQKAGYSGTAIYTRIKPDSIEPLGVPAFDDEGRVTIAHFKDLAVISAYFPNSQGPGLRLEYKLAFCDAIYKKCNELVAQGNNIVLCGDYNIAHKPIDLAHPKANEKNAGYLPEERAWMDFFTAHGFTDTFRNLCAEPGQYTWWSYRQHAREKNVGWRIDYHCVNNGFLPHVKASTILRDVQGSDHCPILLELE